MYRSLVAVSAALFIGPLSLAEDYDEHLCASAQRYLLNAGETDLPVIEQFGTGVGFHTIQMDVSAGERSVIIAMTTDYANFAGSRVATHVSCKMVDRDRVNDVLELDLPGPNRQCRAVNERTYDLAFAALADADRQRYIEEGRRLEFGDDVIVPTGGEWLPITMDAFVKNAGDRVVVSAPSVRVPWDHDERNFFQGTQHCKLLTLAAIDRWMRIGAFDSTSLPIPPVDQNCSQPGSMTSNIGSCLFYFAPADATFCQDYSGQGWTDETAREECAKRHASPAALAAAENRYAGAGGVWRSESCDSRADSPTINGTCVFHCRQPDETLWHVGGAIDPQMTRGCDLFVDRRSRNGD